MSIDGYVKKSRLWYSGCDLPNFQNFTHDRIHESVLAHPYSCTSLTSNSGWECLSFIKYWNYEVDHIKESLSPQSYLSNLPFPDQPLSLLVNLALQIGPSYLAHSELCSIMQTVHKIVQISN